MMLSEKILKLRKEKGLSQEELAEKLNVSRQAVSRWESGTALPDALNIVQISKLFGVSTDYLLNEAYHSDKDIPAVKNQKEYILLLAMLIICFVFHIICCYVLLVLPIFPIISLIINIIVLQRLCKKFELENSVNRKTILICKVIYICILAIMAIVPLISVFMMYYSLGF